MRCKLCGNDRFIAHQILHADIICDEDGLYEDDLGKNGNVAVYDRHEPYGPFTCTICGAEYEELKEDEEPRNRDKITLETLKEKIAYELLNIFHSPSEGLLRIAKATIGEMADVAHVNGHIVSANFMREIGHDLDMHLSYDLYNKMYEICGPEFIYEELSGRHGAEVLAKLACTLLDIPKEDLSGVTALSVVKAVVAAECDKRLGLPGYADYLESNPGAAIEAVVAKGNIHDVDAIVHLEELLEIHVSYELYHYIDSVYDDISLEELGEEDIPRLTRLVILYAKNERP